MERVVLIIIVLVAGLFQTTQAQFAFNRNNDVRVDVGGTTLSNPWAGGLYRPQFSHVDLNRDSLMDLLVFDRSKLASNPDTNGYKILPFLNVGKTDSAAYLYAPQYEQNFPPLMWWVVTADYNCDGIPDLITSATQGNRYNSMNVFLGRAANNTVVYDFHGILEDNFSFISVLRSDIPAIIDVNGDGDLDLLAFDNFTNAYVSYFENQSMELTGTCGDTTKFLLVETCWGGFAENQTTNDISFNEPCFVRSEQQPSGGQGPGSARHREGTLIAFDEEGNGSIDLIIGDAGYGSMIKLNNGAGNTNALMVPPADINYPSYDVPIDLPVFPAGFYLDVDNDEKEDLVVAVNSTDISVNYQHVWFYKDTSTTDTVKLSLQQRDFLMDGMIEMGTGAYPAFFDYDGDSILDLLIGNFGYNDYSTGTYEANFSLYINRGSKESPYYELADDDYLGMGNYRSAGNRWIGLVPTFGDLDGDGDQDLLIGDTTGTLKYFRNIANTAFDTAEFVLADTMFGGIDVDGYSAPCLYDLNGDGLLDIVCGRARGNIHYFQNRGTATNPIFDPIPDNYNLGEMDVRVSVLPAYSVPHVSTLGTQDTLYILVGNSNGRLAGYLVDTSKLISGAFDQPFTKFSDIDVGERSSLAIADITNDGKFEMVVGSWRGGLEFFTQSDSIAEYNPPVDPCDTCDTVNPGIFEPILDSDLQLYPNPATNRLTVAWQNISGQYLSLMIMDYNGKLLLNKSLPATERGSTQLSIDELPEGVYLVRMISDVTVHTRKIIKLK